MIKGAGDKALTIGLIAVGQVIFGLGVVAVKPYMAMAALPYLIASIVIHWAYFYLLNVAYRLGDLSLIYPISRGLAPVLVALGAQWWIGESLSLTAWAGILSVCTGIMVLAYPVLRGALPAAGVLAAVGVGLIVASYTLIDGIGVRSAENPFGYIGWLFVGSSTIALYTFPTRMDRLRALPRKTVVISIIGGVVSALAYALVMFAQSVAPIGLVSALRETSVIFAALIGVMWFGEGPKTRRMIAAGIVAVGIVLISGYG